MKRLTVILLTALCLSAFVVPADAELLQASGKVTLLRVHDVGTKYGPSSDQIDVEVIFHLDTQLGKAFGFKLRNDTNRPAHQGMLDLLRDAFRYNWTVTTDFRIDDGKKNGVAIRVWVKKSARGRVPVRSPRHR